MRSLALLLLCVAAHAQSTGAGSQAPYIFNNNSTDGKISPTALDEDFAEVFNQIHQQKVTTSNLTVNGVVTAVSASPPLCSSVGIDPVISFCGSIIETQVTNLVSDLAAKASLTALNNFIAASDTQFTGIAVSTTVIQSQVTALEVSTVSLQTQVYTKVNRAGDTLSGWLHFDSTNTPTHVAPFDNFSDASYSNNPVWTTMNACGSYRASTGGLEIDGVAPCSPVITVPMPNQSTGTWSFYGSFGGLIAANNGTAYVDFLMSSSNTVNQGGGEVYPTGSGYALSFLNNAVTLNRVDGSGAGSTYTPLTSVAVNTNTGHTYTVTLDSSGNFTLSIDGYLAATTVDTTYTSGGYFILWTRGGASAAGGSAIITNIYYYAVGEMGSGVQIQTPGSGVPLFEIDSLNNGLYEDSFDVSANAASSILSMYNGFGGVGIRLDSTLSDNSWINTPGKFGIGNVNPIFAVDVTSDVRINGTGTVNAGTALEVPHGGVEIGSSGGNGPSGDGNNILLEVDNGPVFISTIGVTSLSVNGKVCVGCYGSGPSTATAQMDVRGTVGIGSYGIQSKFDGSGNLNVYQNVTAQNFFGNASGMTGFTVPTDINQEQGILSSPQGGYSLTIGQDPAGNPASIVMISSTNVSPIIAGEKSLGASTSTIQVPNGFVIGSANTQNTAFYPGGIRVNTTDGITNLFGIFAATQTEFEENDQNAVMVAGGIRAGCGSTVTPGCGTPIINTSGQIPALTSTYLANMDGSHLTNLVSTGSLSAYLPLTAGTGNVITGELYLHTSDPYIEMQDTSDTDGTWLGTIDFGNPTDNRHQIISTSQNGSSLLGMEGMLIVGAATTVDTAGGNRGVVLAGHETLQPDVWVSSYGMVMVGSTNPISGLSFPTGSAVLEVAGPIVSTGNVTVQGNAFSVGGSTFVVTGGEVGIGTTTPNSAIQVRAKSINNPSLSVGQGWFEAGYGSFSNIDFGGYVGSPYGDWIQVRSDPGGSGLPLSLNPLGGNVGIGTTSPATTLDVNGSATLELGTTGAVLCLTSSHVIGHCTSGASCTGTCTCTCVAN